MITQSQLKSLLNYNPDTGIFTWINPINKNNITGSLKKSGYIQITIKGKKYYAHRLAWLYVYGKFSNESLDHVNCIKNDNRIINLRISNKSQNSCNVKITKRNTSGIKGVYFDNKLKKWRAFLTVNKKQMSFGFFENINDAKISIHNARIKFHKEYANHGIKNN